MPAFAAWSVRTTTLVPELLAQFYLVVRSQGLAIKLDVGQGPLERFQNGP
eukprot:COSAG05_NODE_14759_length_387_cov_3067.750000_1_plen_49_part_10